MLVAQDLPGGDRRLVLDSLLAGSCSTWRSRALVLPARRATAMRLGARSKGMVIFNRAARGIARLASRVATV